MDRRNSITGRLSLSTANITNPIAESTHINGSSIHAKFPWGGKIISSPKSSDIVVQKKTPRIQMSPVNKIDPRVYIDAQSKGLASRIVKYHENSHKLSRSFSTGHLYNKPGQFPVVHLKKKEIPYKPNRNINVSMVRIAPPDKTIFQANTRSSILRTGSIVPTVSLHRGNEQISGENRPILHPAGNDIAPTRSVLDALREISRKRINSDELDSADNVKKYCKEQDEINGNGRIQLTYNSPLSKRQREGTSPLNSMTNTSPEQVSKKRLCSRNNDVTSSLSSSLIMITPKRKFNDVQAQKSPDKITKSESPSSPKSKQQCHDSKYVPLHNFESVVSGQITPLPPTPAVEPAKSQEIDVTSTEPKYPVGNEKPKPKLTLFNKNYDEAPVVKITNNFSSKLDDYDLSGIKFVKPKNNSQVLETNPLIERTKKSKLALMLSGLSGELNEDELDAAPKAPTELKKIAEEIPASTVTTASSTSTIPTTSQSISFATKTTVSTTTIPTTSAVTHAGKDEPNTSKVNPITTPTLASVSTAKSTIDTATSQSITSISSTSTTTTTKGFSFPTVANNKAQSAAEVSSSPSSLSGSKPTSAGFNFGTPPKSTSSAATSPLTNTTSTVASQLLQPSTTATFSNMASSSSTSPTLAQSTLASSGKINTSAAPVNWQSLSAASTIMTTGEKTSLRPPVTSSNLSNLFGNPTNATAISSANPSLSFTSPSKPLINFANSGSGDGTNGIPKPPSFGISSSQSPAAMSTSTTAGKQFGSFTIPQKPTYSTSNNSNTNFVSANSTFTTPTNTSFDFSAENSKPPNIILESKPHSGGFSFQPTNQTSSPSTSKANASFMLGSSLNQNQKPISTATSSGFSFSTTTSTSGGFAFPASKTTGNNTNATENKPVFSFGKNNPNPSSGFTLSGATTPNKSQSSSGTFGMPTQQQPVTLSSATSVNMTQNNPNPFAFGAPQTQQPLAVTSGIFGQNKSENMPSGFAFTNSSQPQNTIATSGGFSSGQSAFSAPAPSTNSMFGAPTNTTFGTSTTTSNSLFGAPTTTSSSGFGGSALQSSPVFGAPNTGFAAPTTTASAPAFGTPSSDKNSVFGPHSTENKPASFIFGSSPATNNNESTPSKSFSFGGSSSTSTGFAFNATSNAPESKNLFGTTGSSSNTFSFGSTAVNNNTTKPMFGAPINNNNTTSASPFGSSIVEQPKSFNFTAGTNNSAAPNPFGTSASNNNSEKTFAFGAPNQQISNNNNNNKSFNFGVTSSNPPPFGFQSPATPAGANSDANKTFNYEGSSTKTASTPFGGASGPMFNFSAGQNVNATNPTTPNPFNIGPSSSPTTTTGDRVIRKAARRIK